MEVHLKPKTLPEHVASVECMARFAFFYSARWLRGEFLPEEPMSRALGYHTPLFFHGLGFPDPKLWLEIPLTRDLMRSADELATLAPQEFEEAMWQLNGKAINLRAEEHYPASRGIAAAKNWNCGSLKYDPPGEEFPRRVPFHIYNSIAPRSLLDEPEYLAKCFFLLMKECELRFNADTLFCSSWLNDFPRWLAFFPEEWHRNLSAADPRTIPGMTVGSWGFIYDARGCMNEKRLKLVRENGKLPYLSRKSHCSFAAMREHLSAFCKVHQ